ncbi:MAG: DUF459 domain-containing protein [Hyphomicrobiaceae bacterium]|nr:DUF459 domain-containing protein [Hyphomicrobiaceae bacterium]
MALVQIFLSLVLAWQLSVASAIAQTPPPRTSFLNPFPKGDVYRLHVVGDWYADGLHGQIAETFTGHPRIRVERSVLSIKSLRRANWDDGITPLEDAWKTAPIDIAVVMFGVAEIGSMRMPGSRRLRFGEEGWTAQYTARVDRMMKALKGTSGAVYWLSLPVVRRDDRSENYQQINEIIRERAYVNGVKFIDIFPAFADEDGDYNAYGPDLEGKTKRLRTKDGVYFTVAGNRKLAHFVEREIKRDLTRAATERTVPLAGSELEQKRINPEKSAPAGPSDRGSRKRTVKVARLTPNGSQGGAQLTGNGASGPKFGQKGRELKADNGSIVIAQAQGGRRARTIKLTIVRPPISAAVIDIVTRKQSPDRPAQLGDNIAVPLPGGATLMSSITPANPVAGGGQRAKLSPTQSPYFKVWAKGERLLPRKGRADDFVWPLPEPQPVVRKVREEPPQAGTQPLPVDGMPPLPERNPVGRARSRKRR